jgi:hypothetical protein
MSDNTTPKPMRIALANLTPERYSALERAMSNILSTGLASETFARSLTVFQHEMSIKIIMARTETTISVIWSQAS